MLALKTVLPSIVLGAGFASALTNNCLNSLKGLLTNPDAACLNAPALLQIAINQDVPVTIGNWLNGFCASGECSSESITKIVANVTTGCVEDITAIGISATQTEITGVVDSIAQRVFPTARKVACLKDTTSGLFCPVEMITSLEGIIGKLGIEDLSWFNLVQDAKTLLSSPETKPELACSQCVQSAYSVARGDFSEVLGREEVSDALVNVCGAEFISAPAGELSPNVQASANTAAFLAETPNSATSTLSRAAWSLGALGALFSLLL